MTTKFVKIPIYYFNELEESVKEKIIDSEMGQSFASFDADCSIKCVIDEWIEKLENLGFLNSEILYSVAFSQGDGACFTCKNINLVKLAQSYESIFDIIKEIDEDFFMNLDIEIYHRGHYYHEMSIYCTVTEWESSIDYAFSENETFEEKFERISSQINPDILEKAIISIARELSREIYKEMCDSVLSCYKPENISDGIIANEYIFDSLGNCMNRYESILEEE
jgi:hypothetical protein